MIEYRTVDSPIGLLTLAGRDPVLTNLRMVDQTYEPSRTGWTENPRAFAGAVEQLGAYFAGELTEFDIELDLRGSEFQRRVWRALQTIPTGNQVVRRNRRADRRAWRRARRRIGQRAQPDRDRGALPSRHRRQRS